MSRARCENCQCAHLCLRFHSSSTYCSQQKSGDQHHFNWQHQRILLSVMSTGCSRPRLRYTISDSQAALQQPSQPLMLSQPQSGILSHAPAQQLHVQSRGQPQRCNFQLFSTLLASPTQRSCRAAGRYAPCRHPLGRPLRSLGPPQQPKETEAQQPSSLSAPHERKSQPKFAEVDSRRAASCCLLLLPPLAWH